MISAEKRQIFENVPVWGRPLNNMLLIRIDLTEKQTGKSGLFLGDASWDEAGLITRYGTVIAVPDRLHYVKTAKHGSEWLTDMEVQVGDKVLWTIMSAYDCPVIKDGDDYYFLIKYQDLVIKFYGDAIIPLNGYVVAEAVIEEVRSKSFSLGEKHLLNKGLVKYVGAPNKEYGYEMCDAEDVLPGDTVTLLAPMFTYLEDKRYAILPSNLGYFQRRWVVMTTR